MRAARRTAVLTLVAVLPLVAALVAGLPASGATTPGTLRLDPTSGRHRSARYNWKIDASNRASSITLVEVPASR